MPRSRAALDDVHLRRSRFLAALAGGDEPELVRVLGWLWDAVAGPVLDGLGLTGPPGDGRPWPRVWWCPSGPLASLPLHAAGHHRTRADPVPRTVIDRVVSSYTPTVRALVHARRPRPAGARGGDRIMVVAMPRTPGRASLPGVRREVRMIDELFGGRFTAFEDPGRDDILGELPAYPWAHFGCHAVSSLDDPSGSRLLLRDHESRPLAITDIVRLRLDRAEFAFLSACSTARAGAALADEAIHLTSSFQLAGYRHVIGTLWKIADRHAVAVAADVYGALARAGTADGAAEALHAATRALRARLADWPSTWAAHIHSGA
ncbi:MAG TPA: CHAT domain-containing protein [Nonomuraea sp.]|nr:CHAT domain-containing protein [Nonomuraea sp.]